MSWWALLGIPEPLPEDPEPSAPVTHEGGRWVYPQPSSPACPEVRQISVAPDWARGKHPSRVEREKED